MNDDTRRRLGEILGKVGFDKALSGIELVSAGAGRANARLLVSEPVENIAGTLHGGAIATIVDAVGTIAIVTGDRNGRPGVTTDLNVSYFSPAPSGRSVVAEAQVLKVGRTLAFVSVDVKREDDGALVAQGRMTKFLGHGHPEAAELAT
jgi:acyl-coenzyme A thioesterase 13